MAVVVAKECSISMDEVLWSMSVPRTFKILASIQRSNSTKPIPSRFDRKVNHKVAKAFK